MIGGIHFFKIAGEGSNHYLDYEIINHQACGWNSEMEEELNKEFCDKKANTSHRHNAMVSLYNFCITAVIY